MIKAYKGFNKDMKCRDFQYKEGGEYEHPGEVKACESGFHACEYPLDCFSYYSPADSVFHEVELSGDFSKDGDDTKVAASKIKIGARLDIAGLVNASFEYVKEKSDKTNQITAKQIIKSTQRRATGRRTQRRATGRRTQRRATGR